MKTTVEISDATFEELKNRAKEQNLSMREILEAALRSYLESTRSPKPRYSMPDRSIDGNGVCEGIEEGAWESIRAAIYEGRGG